MKFIGAATIGPVKDNLRVSGKKLEKQNSLKCHINKHWKRQFNF